MLEIFTSLTNMLNQSWWIALTSSFIWGVLSVILSPCHMATVPLIVGFINDRDNVTKARALLVSGMFALGILISIGIIGLITSLLGRIMGDIGGAGNYIVGAFLVFFGIYMMDIIDIPFMENRVSPIVRKKSVPAAFLMGLVFGIALGPCTFAFMAPMLGLVFNIASKNTGYAIVLLFSFAVGHSIIILLAGTFTNVLRRFLNWNKKTEGVVWLKRVCGLLIIVAAIYLFISA